VVRVTTRYEVDLTDALLRAVLNLPPGAEIMFTCPNGVEPGEAVHLKDADLKAWWEEDEEGERS
jgi:hypothetical protein